MSDIGSKMRGLKVEAVSPDGCVKGLLEHRDRFAFSLIDEDAFYDYETSTDMAAQFESLLRGLMAGRRSGTTSIIKEFNGKVYDVGSHPDAQRRAYAANLREVIAEGTSTRRFVDIYSVGLEEWRVHISDDALDALNGFELCAEVRSAMQGLLLDYSMQLHEIKTKVFGSIGVQRKLGR